MLVLEYKVKCKKAQYSAIDDAIRTTQFIRNKAIKFWMDADRDLKVDKFTLNKYSTQLRKEFLFVADLNSMAVQSAAERGWFAISRFYDSVAVASPRASNCKSKKSGKKAENAVLGSPPAGSAVQRQSLLGETPKTALAPLCWNNKTGLPHQVERFSKTGFPRFQKDCRSVEYKTSGWKLHPTKRRITFTDKKGIGDLKLLGKWDLQTYDTKDIKRIRLIRRADGYYAQFCIGIDVVDIQPKTGQEIGLDVGIESFYSDSNGHHEPNPKFLRKAQASIKQSQRSIYKKVKGSSGRRRARKVYAKKHLKVSRQRIEHAKRVARCVIKSNDLVAYEDLRVSNMVKNHCLAKSISDASWYLFRQWLEYFAVKFDKLTVAVPPHYTSQECSSCGVIVKKTLSTRTHNCVCGCQLHRDVNAAVNILNLARQARGGHPQSNAVGVGISTLVGASLLEQVLT